jgi:hypothetical protein
MSSASRAALLLAVAGLGGCANAWRDFSNRSSDDYKIAEARKALDRLDFEGAIVNIDPLLARRGDEEEIAYIGSAAYAGRAGLRILDLFAALSSDLGTKTLFTIFAQHYEGADDDDAADMETAISILENFGPRAADRSGNLNFYALFLFYSRIGLTLNRYAFNPSNMLRANFSVCHAAEDLDGAVTGLPNPMVDRIMTSVPRILETIPAIGAGSGLPNGAIDTTVLDTLFGGAAPFDPIPCASDQTNLSCVAARILIANSDIGLGTNDPITPIPCNGAITP